MKLVVESDGTLKGTRLDFQMTADEIPKMIARAKSHKGKRLKRIQPPAVATSSVHSRLTLVS